MNVRPTTILLTIIAINLTVISLDRVVDRFIPDAIAASSIQKVAICHPTDINHCLPIVGRRITDDTGKTRTYSGILAFTTFDQRLITLLGSAPRL